MKILNMIFYLILTQGIELNGYFEFLWHILNQI